VARTDLHTAPTAQRDRTQIHLVCAHALACTEGADGRADRRHRAREARAWGWLQTVTSGVGARASLPILCSSQALGSPL